MKLSEFEIVGSIILAIIFVILMVNFFWADPKYREFCGDGSCSKNEEKSCQVDCNWCGDGYCQNNEDCSSCQVDCGNCKASSFCGDNICNLEECETGCAKDCSFSQCQNGKCEFESGENCISSPIDCKCLNDEKCDNSIKKCIKITCGDGTCGRGESIASCPNDCKEEYKTILVDPDKDYSIIFVHGHSKTEVEGYQPTELEEFQDKLTEEGYSDMGMVLPSDYPPKLTKGAWSGKKVSVIMTYYANKYDKLGNVVGSDDNQHISIYAERLRDVVEVIKHNTGKNKVIIIAHSMGGLVSREYIKNRGGINSVDKLIMVGTPNHGTYGYIAGFCGTGIAGRSDPTPECGDMNAESNFLKDLNNPDETPGNIKYLTIIGRNKKTSFCPNNEYWDNVICSSSVYLGGAENYYYDDTSEQINLHILMVKPSRAPLVYNKIISFIKR